MCSVLLIVIWTGRGDFILWNKLFKLRSFKLQPCLCWWPPVEELQMFSLKLDENHDLEFSVCTWDIEAIVCRDGNHLSSNPVPFSILSIVICHLEDNRHIMEQDDMHIILSIYFPVCQAWLTEQDLGAGDFCPICSVPELLSTVYHYILLWDGPAHFSSN